MKHYSERITINAQTRFGRPTIRGMRISVYDILGWYANGLTTQDILNDFPELAAEDLQAALAYAAYYLIKTFLLGSQTSSKILLLVAAKFVS
jgi:uncharacterized protein (DUF433 family)